MSETAKTTRRKTGWARRAGPTCRRGATTFEMAITLMVFLTLVLGMLDLGIAVFRREVLMYATRQLVRQSIVHGALATELGPWGPTSYSGKASDTDPMAAVVQTLLSDAGLDPDNVTIQVDWIDGGNDQRDDDRIQVSLSTPYQSITTFIFGDRTFTLTATSVMPIAH